MRVNISVNPAHILIPYRVIAVDSTSSSRPKVLVRLGQTGSCSWFTGDLVIAADGIKSVCRKQMATAGDYLNNDRPYPTGDAAFRLLISRERVHHDPELLSMLNRDVAMRYMGPGGHVMAYPLKGNQMYNMVLLHPSKVTDDVSADVWTTTGDRSAMLDFYASWSPMIRKWLSYSGEENDKSILEWNLNTYPPLPTWIQGGVALMGDACHPMLPYVAQGAANGIEDAAVIAAALTCTSNVQLALFVYEAVRKERAERIAASASGTSRSLHLPDGPEQEERDMAIKSAGRIDGTKEVTTADKWRDSEWQEYMWGVDVMRETIENWDQLSAGFMQEPKQVAPRL